MGEELSSVDFKTLIYKLLFTKSNFEDTLSGGRVGTCGGTEPNPRGTPRSFRLVPEWLLPRVYREVPDVLLQKLQDV